MNNKSKPRNPDHVRRHNAPSPDNKVIAERIEELVLPAMTGSINGLLLQVWSTWLFYAILVDLADALAEELMLPFDRISLATIKSPSPPSP